MEFKNSQVRWLQHKVEGRGRLVEGREVGGREGGWWKFVHYRGTIVQTFKVTTQC